MTLAEAEGVVLFEKERRQFSIKVAIFTQWSWLPVSGRFPRSEGLSSNDNTEGMFLFLAYLWPGDVSQWRKIEWIQEHPENQLCNEEDSHCSKRKEHRATCYDDKVSPSDERHRSFCGD